MGRADLPLLVETHWLEEHLRDPELRIFDCSVTLNVTSAGVRPESGHGEWSKAHIPGSAFADLMGDLSKRDSTLPFMLPPADQFAAVMSRYGVGNAHSVVLYDTGAHMWATRLWWMLRVFGFDRAAVLNGGWRKWSMEKRPTSSQESTYLPAVFTAHERPQLVLDKAQVRESIGRSEVCLINALSTQEHSGAVTRVARSGRIPSSKNVPAQSLIDPVTGAYLPLDELRAKFEASGALASQRVVTYCGGGIAATSDAFILTLLGASNVAVYDGSLIEWAADATMTMETD